MSEKKVNPFRNDTLEHVNWEKLNRLNNPVRVFHDSEGNSCSIHQLVKREPNWAVSRITKLESDNKVLIEKVGRLEELLRFTANALKCDPAIDDVVWFSDGCTLWEAIAYELQFPEEESKASNNEVDHG